MIDATIYCNYTYLLFLWVNPTYNTPFHPAKHGMSPFQNSQKQGRYEN